MSNKIIFVACDTSNIRKVKKIILETKSSKLKNMPKFGHQFLLPLKLKVKIDY